MCKSEMKDPFEKDKTNQFAKDPWGNKTPTIEESIIGACFKPVNSKECSGNKGSQDAREINFPSIPKLSYKDVERIVKPLEWGFMRSEDKDDCEYAFINQSIAFRATKSLGDCRLITWDEFGQVVDSMAIVEDGERDLNIQKQNAQRWLIGLVAGALGAKEDSE